MDEGAREAIAKAFRNANQVRLGIACREVLRSAAFSEASTEFHANMLKASPNITRTGS